MLDVSPGAVGNWESGANKPKISRLKDIADRLSVSIDFLMGEPSTAATFATPPALARREEREEHTGEFSTEALQRTLQGRVQALLRAASSERRFLLENIEVITKELIRREQLMTEHRASSNPLSGQKMAADDALPSVDKGVDKAIGNLEHDAMREARAGRANPPSGKAASPSGSKPPPSGGAAGRRK